MQNPSIIVKNLSVAMQDNTVFDGVSFTLQPGQHLAISGQSGSGKTTLAQALTDKIHFSGNIFLNADSQPEHGQQIIFVEQRYSFKNLSGMTDFYYQQRFNSFDADDAPTVLDELTKLFPGDESKSDLEKMKIIGSGLKRLGIFHLKNSPLIQLSSGEHKRFQLIKALINPPAFLILDSPYTGLDAASREGLNKILADLTKNTSTQIILIPGSFPVPDYITHIAYLDNKTLDFFGAKEDFEFPEEDFSAPDQPFFNHQLLPEAEENSVFESILEMKNVHIKYGQKSVIENLNWKVNRGEKWLLKGRNGAGKSSLLNLVTGDHPQAYSNEIYLFGKMRGTGESIWDLKKKTGYVSPELHAFFDKNISCFDTIASGFFDTIGLYKNLTKKQNDTVLQWLDFLHVSPAQFNKPLHSISAGEQRLMLFARALVKNPPLLILDEPCQGLDLHQRNQFISLIDLICSRSQRTLIYVSHEEAEVPECIDKVFDLETGKTNNFSINKNKHALIAEAS